MAAWNSPRTEGTHWAVLFALRNHTHRYPVTRNEMPPSDLHQCRRTSRRRNSGPRNIDSTQHCSSKRYTPTARQEYRRGIPRKAPQYNRNPVPAEMQRVAPRSFVQLQCRYARSQSGTVRLKLSNARAPLRRRRLFERTRQVCRGSDRNRRWHPQIHYEAERKFSPEIYDPESREAYDLPVNADWRASPTGGLRLLLGLVSTSMN